MPATTSGGRRDLDKVAARCVLEAHAVIPTAAAMTRRARAAEEWDGERARRGGKPTLSPMLPHQVVSMSSVMTNGHAAFFPVHPLPTLISPRAPRVGEVGVPLLMGGREAERNAARWPGSRTRLRRGGRQVDCARNREMRRAAAPPRRGRETRGGGEGEGEEGEEGREA